MTKPDFQSQYRISTLTPSPRKLKPLRGFGGLRCESCRMHRATCICSLVPNLDLSTKVSLVVPANELRKSTNTGQLVHRCLSNSTLNIKGIKDEPLDFEAICDASYRSVVLYPSDEAQCLTTLQINPAVPINLIVPDGTWKQARKIVTRSPELSNLPAVTLPISSQSTYQLRRTHNVEGGLATIEAVAIALGILEDEASQESLVRIFRIMVERTLYSRGKMKKEDVYGPEWA